MKKGCSQVLPEDVCNYVYEPCPKCGHKVRVWVETDHNGGLRDRPAECKRCRPMKWVLTATGIRLAR